VLNASATAIAMILFMILTSSLGVFVGPTHNKRANGF
jgi:hypothetical protein